MTVPGRHVVMMRKHEFSRQRKDRLLQELELLSVAKPLPAPIGVLVSDKPSTTQEERVALFMRLFRCREDVFPKMWENRKAGTKGYVPACKVEWARGVCDKPKIRCSERPGSAPSSPAPLSHPFPCRTEQLKQQGDVVP